MKRNNLYDFLIIVLVQLGISCFPFARFIKIDWLVLLIQIVCQIGLFVFYNIFIRKKTNLSLKTNKTNLVWILLLIPTLTICFSNYFTLFFVDSLTFSINKYLWLSIILNLLIALNEEFIFRLIFINNLEDRPNYYKLLMSAIVFGGCHFANFLGSFDPSALLQVVYTTALGLLLAFTFIKTNSIIPCITIHFLFNTFNNLVFSSFAYTFNIKVFLIVNVLVGVAVCLYVLAVSFIRYLVKKEKII